MNSRTLVIGDIHGADLALEQILERAAVTPEDAIICLGDYVDGWSGSSKVIRRLIRLSETNDCIFIRGNHDAWCEEWLESGASNSTWLFNGGEATLNSYEGFDLVERTLHLAFFNRMRSYYIDKKERLFIHAGFSSMHGPSHETYQSNFSWDRTLWETALCLDPALTPDSPRYPKRLQLFTQIFIGHTPTINYGTDKPMQAANLWNIDTGAAFDGRLSIMDVDTKQVWQSDPVRELYPNEKGRNRD